MIRRFLIKEHPEGLDQIQSYTVEYFCQSFRPALYYMQNNDEFYQYYDGTAATGNKHNKLEVNYPIYTHQRYKALGCVYNKDRYPVPLEDGNTAFVDFCRKPYLGLQFIEVEFEDEEAAAAFAPPAWFGKEVTENPEFSFLQICHAPV